MGYIKSHSYIY